jgi:DNA-binding NtrC family response regulator/tetratricopeptide (TPR) repeat protein
MGKQSLDRKAEQRRMLLRLGEAQNAGNAEEAARSALALGDLLLRSSSYREALSYFDEAAKFRRPDDGAVALNAMLGKSECLLRLGELEQCADICEEVADDDNADEQVTARAFLNKARAEIQKGNYDSARKSADAAREILKESDAEELFAQANRVLGIVAAEEGDLPGAEKLFHKCIWTLRKLDDIGGLSMAYANLAVVMKRQGNFSKALGYFSKVMRMASEAGDQQRIASTLANMGLCLYRTGRLDEAEEKLEESLQRSKSIGYERGVVSAELSLANIYRLKGEMDKAAESLDSARARSAAKEFGRAEVLGYEFAGDLAFDQGETDEAWKDYLSALKLAGQQSRANDLLTEIHRRRAEVLLLRGDLAGARAECISCLGFCRRVGDRYERALAFRVLAKVLCAEGNLAASEKFFMRSEAELMTMGARFELARLYLERSALFGSEEVARDPGAGALKAIVRGDVTRAAASFSEIGASRWVEKCRAIGAKMKSVLDGLEPVPRHSSEEARKDDSAQALGSLPESFSDIVTASSKLIDVLEQAQRVARSSAPVLIAGESGVGKELVARAIHDSSGVKGEFVAVNVAAVAPTLYESEMFGHIKGAFSGAERDRRGLVEEADGGTLFLDEIGEMPPRLQVKLLRFLQSGEYRRVGETRMRHARVRVVSATNRDIKEVVKTGRLRKDLLYRIAAVTLTIPPLRMRREDIPPLVEHFVERYSKCDRKPISGVSPEAMDALCSSQWTDNNVRELENEVRRCVALCSKGQTITLDLLSPELVDSRACREEDALARGLQERVDSYERRLVLDALRKCSWNKSHAARALGISRSGLTAKLKRLEIEN